MLYKNYYISETFLRLKWQHYRMFFFLLVALHMAFVSCLSTAVILMVKSYQWFSDENFQSLLGTNLTDYTFTELEILGQFDRVMTVIKILSLLVFSIGFFLFIHAIIQVSCFSCRNIKIWCVFRFTLRRAFCHLRGCFVSSSWRSILSRPREPWSLASVY